MPQRFLLFLVGSALLIAGMTISLKNWDAIVIVFRAFLGMILAVGGLAMLSFINDEKN